MTRDRQNRLKSDLRLLWASLASLPDLLVRRLADAVIGLHYPIDGPDTPCLRCHKRETEWPCRAFRDAVASKAAAGRRIKERLAAL